MQSDSPNSEPVAVNHAAIDASADSVDDRARIREAQTNASNVGIKAEQVSVVYRNGTVALEDANFEIPTSTICALVGINGAGKSTLFKALMGFVPLAGGTISLLGQPGTKQLPKNTVAYVPQNEDVDWNFPVLVEDVVMMGRYGHMGPLRRPKKADKKAVADALARVNMSNFTHRQIGELSGGQKKRVFLARSLAQQSRIILLDEPFTGVDVNTEDAIIELLRELRDDGHVILVSTHNLGSVPHFCDQVVLINRTVLDHGKMERVFTQSNLQRAFGGTLRFHVLGPKQLHDDDDQRRITVISDDERPVVLYGDDEASQTAHGPGATENPDD